MTVLILQYQYLLTVLEAGLVDLLSFGLLFSPPTTVGNDDPARPLRLSINELCQELLPEAVGLSDAFGFTDWELDRSVLFLLSVRLRCSTPFDFTTCSALGVYDGRVYEALWEKAQTEPLNQREVTEAYDVCPACSSCVLVYFAEAFKFIGIDQANATARTAASKGSDGEDEVVIDQLRQVG